MSSLLGLPKNKNFPLRARSLFLRWPWISGIILYVHSWGGGNLGTTALLLISCEIPDMLKRYIVMIRAINWFLSIRIQVEWRQLRFVHASYDAHYTLSLVLTCLYDYVYEQRKTKPNENNEITKTTDLNFQATKYDIKQHSDATLD